VLDTPNVDVRVECTRGDVCAIRGPGEREDTPAVERPAAGDHLC
jgi:hypothetical protein